jgi:hypothetical protein
MFFSAGFDPNQPPPPNAYAPGPLAPPPRRGSRVLLWVFGGIGCLGVLALLCCGGLGYFGFRAGTGALTQSLKQEVAGNAFVEQEMGEVQTVSMNLMETGPEQKRRGGEGNWMVFDATGTKGDGKFIVQMSQQPQPGNMFSTIELRTADGKSATIKGSAAEETEDATKMEEAKTKEAK